MVAGRLPAETPPHRHPADAAQPPPADGPPHPDDARWSGTAPAAPDHPHPPPMAARTTVQPVHSADHPAEPSQAHNRPHQDSHPHRRASPTRRTPSVSLPANHHPGNRTPHQSPSYKDRSQCPTADSPPGSERTRKPMPDHPDPAPTTAANAANRRTTAAPAARRPRAAPVRLTEIQLTLMTGKEIAEAVTLLANLIDHHYPTDRPSRSATQLPAPRGPPRRPRAIPPPLC